MTVRWTVRTATGFSAEKRIPLSANKKELLSTKTKVTFLNDVCLTANDDAYANDVSFGNDVGFA